MRKRTRREEIVVALHVEIPEDLYKQIEELQVRGKSKKQVVVELLSKALEEIKKGGKE